MYLLYAAGFEEDVSGTRLQFNLKNIQMLETANARLQAKIANPDDTKLLPNSVKQKQKDKETSKENTIIPNNKNKKEKNISESKNNDTNSNNSDIESITISSIINNVTNNKNGTFYCSDITYVSDDSCLSTIEIETFVRSYGALFGYYYDCDETNNCIFKTRNNFDISNSYMYTHDEYYCNNSGTSGNATCDNTKSIFIINNNNINNGGYCIPKFGAIDDCTHLIYKEYLHHHINSSDELDLMITYCNDNESSKKLNENGNTNGYLHIYRELDGCNNVEYSLLLTNKFDGINFGGNSDICTTYYDDSYTYVYDDGG